jgi:hypothetical protein
MTIGPVEWVRMRVRAYERELAAAPRYVSNELAGTREAAATYRQNAALTRAEAETVPDDDRRQQLAAEADQAAKLADLLDGQAEQLQQVDDARAAWLAHTAQTRVQAELSKAELSARDADDDPDDRVTAAEWKAAHDAALAEDERHRDVTEDDLDRKDEHDHPDEPTASQAGTGRRDVRDEAAQASTRASEDVVRVPDAAETTDSLDWAGQILAEIRYREAADVAEEADHRAAQLNQWHGDDAVAEDHAARESEAAGVGDK